MENKDNKQAKEREAQKANERVQSSKQELTDEQLEKVAGGARAAKQFDLNERVKNL